MKLARVLQVVYRTKDNRIHSDMYINGEILNKSDATQYAQSEMLHMKSRVKKLQIIYSDIPVNDVYNITGKLQVSRNIATVIDPKNKLIAIDKHELPNKYLKLIKIIMQGLSDSRKTMYVDSPPGTPKDDDHRELSQKTVSQVELKRAEDLYSYIIDGSSKEFEDPVLNGNGHVGLNITNESPDVHKGHKSNNDLTEEMSKNIDMLINIGFISPGNYHIRGDMVILNTPMAWAYGDYITNRQGVSQYKRDGIQQRHNRLSLMDIVL